MDSHYDQVMAQRDQAQTDSFRFYFAYSTILDRPAFEEWRAQHGYDFFNLPEGQPAQALDVTLVYDFPSRWWGGRVAGLVDKPGSVVHGVVFRIDGPDWPIIAHKEGAVTSMSVERQVHVKMGESELQATAFTTNPQRRSEEGPISTRFVEALVRGAKASQLPAKYIAELEAVVGT
jgi:gamma-glutamylcyclotransferase